jgi:hypothetical protein
MSSLDIYTSKDKEEEFMWIVNFDIGKLNFCFCIEQVNLSELKKIKNIPSIARYQTNGTPTPAMTKILHTIYTNSTIILHKNLNISQNCTKGRYIEPELIHNMINTLDSYSEYWDKCSIFVVEKQMSFRGKVNTLALKLGSTCQAYFYFRYGRFKHVVEFPAYEKTHVLGSEKLITGTTKTGKTKFKTVDKPSRKKWAIVKAKEILTYRGDTTHPIIIAKRGIKLDDLSDTLLQGQAFIYKMFIEKSITLG